MNDRYLYRGKRTDNGEWITWNILTGIPHSVSILEDTVCACTGLKDKNGKLIWENDITLRTSVTGVHKGKIFYGAEGAFCQKDFESLFENLLLNSESYFEVIGNIFDNPELLEVGE